jgi:hypothetical protein
MPPPFNSLQFFKKGQENTIIENVMFKYKKEEDVSYTLGTTLSIELPEAQKRSG